MAQWAFVVNVGKWSRCSLPSRGGWLLLRCYRPRDSLQSAGMILLRVMILVTLALLLLVAGCAEPTATPFSDPAPTATRFSDPTPTATRFSDPTPTATPFPDPTPTATPFPDPTPTATPFPDPTPTPTPFPDPTPTATPFPGPTPTPFIVSDGAGPCVYGGEIPTERVYEEIKRNLEVPETFNTSTGIEYGPGSRGVEWLVVYEHVDEAGISHEGWTRGYWKADCMAYYSNGSGSSRCESAGNRIPCDELYAKLHALGLYPTPSPTPTSVECAPGGRVPAEDVIKGVKGRMPVPESFKTSTGVEHMPTSRGVEWWVKYEGIIEDGRPLSGFAEGYWTSYCAVRWRRSGYRYSGPPARSDEPEPTN